MYLEVVVVTYFCELCNMDHWPPWNHADSTKDDVEDEPVWDPD